MNDKQDGERQEKNKTTFPCYAGTHSHHPYSSGIFSLSLSCLLWVHICSLPLLLFPVTFSIPHLKITTFKFTLVLLHITLRGIFSNHQFIQVMQDSSFFTSLQRLLSKALTTAELSSTWPLRPPEEQSELVSNTNGIHITDIHESHKH